MMENKLSKIVFTSYTNVCTYVYNKCIYSYVSQKGNVYCLKLKHLNQGITIFKYFFGSSFF